MPILDAIRQRWPWMRHVFAGGTYDRRMRLDKATRLDFVVEVMCRGDTDPWLTMIPVTSHRVV